MASWSKGTFQVHRNPTINMVDASIDFDTGHYEGTLQLTGGSGTRYGYNMSLEIYKGVPGASGSTKVGVIEWNGTSNPTPHSESFSGTLSSTGEGTYYLMMKCNSTSGCESCSSPSSGWISKSTSSGNYSAYTQLGSSSGGSYTAGGINISSASTGKTITITPSHYPSSIGFASNTAGATGKITVRIGAMEKDTPSGIPVTFTGLEPRTTYTVTCICWEDGGHKVEENKSVTTYGTAVTVTNTTDGSISARINVNNNYTGKVEYWAEYDGGSTSHGNTNNGSVVTISGLPSGKTITVYARPVGMDDARGSSSDSTTEIPTIETVSATMSGTTATITPEFNIPEGEHVYWRASIGQQTVAGTDNEPAKFQLLYPGTTYTTIFRATSPHNSTTGTATGTGSTIPVSLFTVTNGDKVDELRYDVRTYAVHLTELENYTNAYVASIHQTRGAFGPTDGLMTEAGIFPYSARCVRRDGNIPSNEIAGYTNIINQKCIVEGLQPNTSYRLYVWLNGCKDFNNDDDAIGYIDFTTKPAAVAGTFTAKVTGRTCTITPSITRWNGTSGLEYSCYFYAGGEGGRLIGTVGNYCNLEIINPATMTGLDNGTKYYIVISAQDNNGNAIEVNNIEVVTYGIKVEPGQSHTTYMQDFSVTYIDGERASTISQDASRGANVKWYILEDGYQVDGIETVNCRRTNPCIFSTNPVLKPNNNYILCMYIDGVVYNGENDTVIYCDFSTINAARHLYAVTQATGETIGVTTIWRDSSAEGYILTVSMVISLDGVIKATKQNTVNGETVWFTNLERGKTYNISYTAQDNEGNSTNDYIYYYPGAASVISETTYKLTISSFLYNTRSIRWTCTCNRALPTGSTIEYYIEQPDARKINWDRTMNSGDTRSYIELTHNTNMVLGVRIKEMRDRNGNWDTTEYIRERMKKLSVEMTGAHPHVRIIDTFWQAYQDADEMDKDDISNTNIEFVDDLCICTPVLSGKGAYTGSDGSYSGNSEFPPKTRYFRGLTGGRQYNISVGVTDGYNTVRSLNYQIYALLQQIRIYDEEAHVFRNATPYLFHSGRWYKAPMYVLLDENKVKNGFYYGDGTNTHETSPIPTPPILKWYDSDPERD